ncbi:MAG: OmpA family protein [Comamonadaceae bacterium]|nr:MAG: OmpA family protein [Comamonadaceae bacterium]
MLPFDQAVAQATDALLAQAAAPRGLAGRLASRRGVLIDPMIDAGSGQRTAATQLLQRQVTERLAGAPDRVEVLPFQAASFDRAAYLLTGTITRQVGKQGAPVRLDLALTDLKSRNVAAQSSALARDDGLDSTPLAFDQDSPVSGKERVIDGYVRTSATAPGQPADAYYMERLVVAPAISDAATLYGSGRYEDSLARYNEAGASTAGEQLRVLSGVYLSLVKLNRLAEAEQAFGKVVGYGIANRQLGVKFLFNPGGTVFWSDPKVSGQYAMWLGQIARASTEAKVCMDIVGHTSRTGAEPLNDALSLQRAGYIRQRLTAQSAVLGPRTRADGKGFRENIIGTGTDNAVDALDRRVEFRIVNCPR